MRPVSERYLATAQYFIDRRGHGLLGPDRFGSAYWQDHLPIREAPSAEGHSVRQLYLLAGVADVYAETGDDTLREAAERLWSEMVATKTYLTGGIGAHHTDEAFGDPYELPNERSYCETCAAIASVMFSWRMLMITGEARYADLIERTLYNGFLGGLSLDGREYIYANPLQVREGHQAGGNDGDYERKTWFRCACCPPNVMRTLASLEHYVVAEQRRRDPGASVHPRQLHRDRRRRRGHAERQHRVPVGGPGPDRRRLGSRRRVGTRCSRAALGGRCDGPGQRRTGDG